MTVLTETRNSRGERLRGLRQQAELTLREAAEKVGLAFSQISKIEKSDSIYIKPSVLQKFAEAYKTSAAFIETGKNPVPSKLADDANAMIALTVSESKPVSHDLHRHSSNARLIIIDDVPLRVIPYLPIRARAGFAESFADDSYKYERKETLAVPGVPDTKEFEEALIIEVDGDSMDLGENSTLRSGARVLATPVQQADWQYMSSGVYCFVFRSIFVIKRVKDNTLLSKGMITLHSDNPNGGSLDVLGEDIRAVWKVRWGVFTPIN